MPETTGAFKAYLEEMAKNNSKIPGKSKKDGKLADVLSEIESEEDSVVSEPFSQDAEGDAAV